MSRRIWVAATMWIMWFIRRFPTRDSRCLTVSPDDASIGSVPGQEANRFRSANVTHVSQDAGSDDWPDAGQLHQRRAAGPDGSPSAPC